MEHLTGLQTYVSELQEQISTLEATVQKLSSRLDESNLNFKYETLIKTYNEAEIENTALKGQLEKSDSELKRLKLEHVRIDGENKRLTQQLQDAATALGQSPRQESMRRSLPRSAKPQRDVYLMTLSN